MLNRAVLDRDKLVQAALTSTGATDPLSGYVDTANADDVVFRGILGTAGSTDVATLAIVESTSTGSTGTAISGATVSSTAGDSDKMMKIGVSRPRLRYVAAKLTRSGVVEWGGTIATVSGVRVKPSTDDATTVLTRVQVTPQST